MRGTRRDAARFRRWLLALAAAIEVSALSALAWSGPSFPIQGVFLFGVAFAAYCGGAFVLWRRQESTGVETWVILWGTAIVARLVLLPAEPRLSDDIWRYLWDGHVQWNGVNPFRYAPADLAVAGLRTPWHALINNPAISTIYPPVSQFAFVLIAALGGGLMAAKGLWIAIDLIAAAVLVSVARRIQAPAALVALLYAWSPLLIVETAWSGHLEPLGILWLIVFLSFLLGARPLMASGALALAALTKFAPLAVVPAVVRRLGWRGIAVIALTLVVFTLPYAGAGEGLWRGLTTYARHWRFNAGAFALLESVFPGPLRPRVLSGILVGVVIAALSLRAVTPDRALLWVLGAGVALSPTVHPWYVLWVLPFAALRLQIAWIYLSGSVFLGYWGLDAFQRTGVWPEPTWARLTVWCPFFALLLWQGWRALRGDGVQPEPQVARSEQQ